MALWYVLANADTSAKVLITAPTFRQVDDIVFNEIRSDYRDSPRWKYDSGIIYSGFFCRKGVASSRMPLKPDS